MKRLFTVGAAIALLASAGVVMAAGPTKSPAPSNPAPSPSTSAGASSAAQLPSWTAQVNPVQVAGSATVQQLADGRGQITMTLSGMINEAGWTVTVDKGTLDFPIGRAQIAFKHGDDIQRVATDTIRVILSKSEMSAFLAAQKSAGVVVFVSDGTRLSAAVFPVK